MYTGLELAIISYVLGFVIHVAYFRFFEGFYKFVNDLNIITPTCWCFLWPIAWAFTIVYFILYCLSKLFILLYCIVDYVVSGQWNFKW